MADEPKFIESEVVDVMLDEVKSSMQVQIDALTQRNLSYRAGLKRLEIHSTRLEAELARFRSDADESKLEQG